MRDPVRAQDPAAKRLDDISADLADVLQHADALLDEWARFGATVQIQVQREAGMVADAVASATGVAVERAASGQLANLRAEIAQLEQRVRAAARLVAEQRAMDRRLLGGIAAGVAIALALLVVLVARSFATVPPTVAPEPVRIEPATAPPLDARQVDAPVDAFVPLDAPAPAPPAPSAAAHPPTRHR